MQGGVFPLHRLDVAATTPRKFEASYIHISYQLLSASVNEIHRASDLLSMNAYSPRRGAGASMLPKDYGE